MFFKIESWNFKHLFEKEFWKTSQITTQADNWLATKIVWIPWISWNFVRFKKFFFKHMLKVSAFYLEKKVSFLKKIWSKLMSLNRPRYFQQMALCCLNFQQRFWPGLKDDILVSDLLYFSSDQCSYSGLIYQVYRVL